MQPKISVIISAYKYPEALRCAIQSALLQTFQNFEVLVMGDGDEGASEKVAASLGDKRVSWHNLPAHSGGPSAPRNEGLARARGEYIAYLEQDDVWYPTHLQSCLDTVQKYAADVAVATLIRYGLEGSGIRQVSGIFPRGQYTADLYVPASSLFHHRRVVEKITGWANPLFSRLPVDGDFISRIHLAKCVIAPTKELTVFNYPSSWRWNSYVKNEAVEQKGMLTRIGTGSDFRHQELIEALTSVASGEGRIISMPNPHIPPREREDKANIMRGLKPWKAAPSTDGRYTMEGDVFPNEWHPLEVNPHIGSFRWSGPSRSPGILLPINAAAPCDIKLKILWFINADDAENLKVSIEGVEVPYSVQQDAEGVFHFSFRYEPQQNRNGDGVMLRLSVPRCYQPHAFDINADLRHLGLAVSAIEVIPHQECKKEAA